MNDPILEVVSVSKKFVTAEGDITILRDVNMQVNAGEKVAIIGPSGSGKSTLLSILGLLDTPSTGLVKFSGQDLSNLTEAEQAKTRNQKIGFIFQSFELISSFTARENVVAPVEIAGDVVDQAALQELMTELGISKRSQALPATLSGGEKQRVAIGRALFHKPDIIFADEPTGSLDRITGEKVIDLLLDAVSSRGTTLVLITHDESLASKMDRVFVIQDKCLHERS